MQLPADYTQVGRYDNTLLSNVIPPIRAGCERRSQSIRSYVWKREAPPVFNFRTCRRKVFRLRSGSHVQPKSLSCNHIGKQASDVYGWTSPGDVGLVLGNS